MGKYNSFVYDMANGRNSTREIKKVNLYLGLFFDGTCNNMWDSLARELYTEKYLKASPKKEEYINTWIAVSNSDKELYAKAYAEFNEGSESSYENDYSNAARLYQNCSDTNYSIYIEGPGTTSHQLLDSKIEYGKDQNGGLGFGHGDSGIRAKVRSACEKLADKIASKMGKSKSKMYPKVIIDLYGFSRGAAAARNFIYEVTSKLGIYSLDENVDQQQYCKAEVRTQADPPLSHSITPRGFLGYYLLQRGFDLNSYPLEIEIRGAGLFDTVSSYEPRTRTGLIGSAVSHNFENDVRELHLNEIKQATYVLHLTAMDEQRENFSLTTIDSALAAAAKDKRKTVLEIAMPGMHSDVGGSYRDHVTKEIEVLDIGTFGYGWITNLRDKYNREKMRIYHDRLTEQGWFRPSECTTSIENNCLYEVKFKRKDLSNHYSFLPLHLMTSYINDEWQLTWVTPEQLPEKKPVFLMEDIRDNYTLPLAKPSFPSLFTMEGNTIKLRAGGISFDLYPEDIPQGNMVQRLYNEDHHWFIKGEGKHLKGYNWTSGIEYIVKYLFEHIEKVIPNHSLEPLQFAVQCYMPDGKVTDKPVFPAAIVNGIDLSLYQYSLHTFNNPAFPTEESTIEKFRSNLDIINRRLMEQIYLRRLRNRYLHWSSNFAWNAVVTSSNFPRIVDEEKVICKRLVIRG